MDPGVGFDDPLWVPSNSGYSDSVTGSHIYSDYSDSETWKPKTTVVERKERGDPGWRGLIPGVKDCNHKLWGKKKSCCFFLVFFFIIIIIFKP